MKRTYTIREIHTAEGKYKRLRVYESLQHIWNEVHFEVSRENASLPGTWYSERGARIIFKDRNTN